MKEGATAEARVGSSRLRRWSRLAIVVVGCAVVGLVAYLVVQQFRIRPAPRVDVKQVGWVAVRATEVRLLGLPRDREKIAEILDAWNSSEIGPLTGETTGWAHVAFYLRDGRVFSVYCGESPKTTVLWARGRWRTTAWQVYPSKEFKAYLLDLLSQYEELDQ